MSTPFLDSLPAPQRAIVWRKSLGSKRPSYFSVVAAQAKADSTAASVELPDDFTTNVQIGLDLEAALILLPTKLKQDLIGFINDVLLVLGTAGRSDDLELLQEVVSVRAESYQQTNIDIADPLRTFDATRLKVFDFLTDLQASGDSASSVLPDLSPLFAAFSNDYERLSRTEVLAMHDRLTDSATVAFFADDGFERKRELASWSTVLAAYL